VPEKLSHEQPKVFEDCMIRKPESYYITVGDVAKQIGWKAEHIK
jgi:large subunit ribosomal protein L13